MYTTPMFTLSPVRPMIVREAPSNRVFPDRAETPPSPLSTVPFPRDPDYTDRGPLLDEIHQKLAMPAARAALVGLGGVG